MKSLLVVLGLATFLFGFLNFSNASPFLQKLSQNDSSHCGTFTPLYWLNAGTTFTNTLTFGIPMAWYFELPMLFGCRPVSASSEDPAVQVTFDYYGSQYQYLVNDYDSYDDETKRAMMMDGNNVSSYFITSATSNFNNFPSVKNTYQFPAGSALIDQSFRFFHSGAQNITFNFSYDNQNRLNETRSTAEQLDTSSLISGSLETKTTKTTRQQQQQQRRSAGIPLIADVLALKHFAPTQELKMVYAYQNQQLPEQATTLKVEIGNPENEYTQKSWFKTSGMGLITQFNRTTYSNGEKSKDIYYVTYDASQLSRLCLDYDSGRICDEYSYDQQSRLISITQDGQNFAEFVYNEQGQMTVISMGKTVGKWNLQY